MSRAGAAQAPEFSRRVNADEIGDAPVAMHLVAGPEERAALARRFGLVAIDRFSAEARITRARARDESGPVIRVELAIEADLVQTCVVTLAPLAAEVRESGLIVEYALEEGGPEIGQPARRDIEIAPEAPDPPEPLEDGGFDLGELAAQHLALALDPYPRAPGAAVAEGEGRPGEVESPFAALKSWPRRDT